MQIIKGVIHIVLSEKLASCAIFRQKFLYSAMLSCRVFKGVVAFFFLFILGMQTFFFLLNARIIELEDPLEKVIALLY